MFYITADIANSIFEMLVKVGITIVSSIYYVAAIIFEIFMVLADGTVMDSINTEKIISNFYVVIGVVMLFFISFALLKGMINPDDSKQGTSVIKKIIINMVVSAFIMAVLPSIFAFAYDFQKSFIYNYNPIGKFFGYGSLNDGTSDNADPIKQGAYLITNGIYTAFFNANPEECGDGMDIKSCQENISNGDINLATAIDTVDGNGDFYLYADFAENVVNKEIDFNFLLSLIASLFICYVAFSMCFDMALRLVKLVFYQIIAPIPIFLRIIPDGKISGTFNEWVKITLRCYLEVYIRIFAFYFCIYLCTSLIEAPWFATISERGFFIGLLAKALIFMGIVMFMKEAPSLIGKMTGIETKGMKLGIKDKLKDGGFFAATNTVGGGLASAAAAISSRRDSGQSKWSQARGALRGATSGAISGFKHGTKNADFKGTGAAYKRTMRNEEIRSDKDSTMVGRIGASTRDFFGWETKEEEIERKTNKFIDPTTGKRMTAKNDTGVDIGEVDENGNVIQGKEILKNGEEFALSPENRSKVEEHKANISKQKSQNGEKVRQIKDRKSQNENISKSKSKIENLAEKEMAKGKMLLKTMNDKGEYENLTLSYASFDKEAYRTKALQIAESEIDEGNFRLKDVTGKDLSLTLDITNEDGSKSKITLEHATKKEFKKFISDNEDKMSEEDLEIATKKLERSSQIWTQQEFIRSNGQEVIMKDGKGVMVNGELAIKDANSQLLQVQKDCISNVVANNLTQSQAEAFLSSNRDKMSPEQLKLAQDSLDKSIKVHTKEFFIDTNGRDYDLNDDGTYKTDSTGRRILTPEDKSHPDTIAAKKAIAFDITNKGIVDANGNLSEEYVKFMVSKGFAENDIRARKINLEDHIDLFDTNFLSDIKKLGEAQNRDVIDAELRTIEFVQGKLDSQIQTADRILAQGKEQQEVIKHSKAYRAARADTRVVQEEKKK